MNVPHWLTPWRKQTDQNTVTPIRAPLRQNSLFGWIVESFGGSWQGNMALETTQNMLAFSAVYACIQIRSADVSKMRAKLMRRAADGIWDEVEDRKTPFLAVLRKPNRFQTWIQFLAYWISSKLMYGNAYFLLERDNRGIVRAIYPLDARAVTPMVTSDGSVYYKLQSDDLAGVKEGGNLIPASEIIHDRMVTLWHPLIGVSPLYACGASATQGIRIQQNSERFFANQSRPSGHLTAPGKIDDPTAARIKKDFEGGFSGSNLGRLLVTGSDLKFEPFTMPAEQAQLIEQQKWTVEDVARAFSMPLYKIQAGTAPNLTNVGALNLEYFVSTLQTDVESIELLLDEALGLTDQDMCVELDTACLLRMDPLTRSQVQENRVKAATLSPDEARAEENQHPVPGGNTPYMQQQNYSLAALAKRDAGPDPFGTASKDKAPPPPVVNNAADDITYEDSCNGLILVKSLLANAEIAPCRI